MCVLVNPLKFNKNLHNEIVNNKSTLFLTLINNWKKPNHLVLIIGEDVILYNDITQIILWCMIAGISFVSVYDYKNRLSHLELFKALKNNPMIEEINKLTLGFSFNKLNNNSKAQNIVGDTPIQNGNFKTKSIGKHYTDDIAHILRIIDKSKADGNMDVKNRHSYKYGLNGNGCFVNSSSEQILFCNEKEKDTSLKKMFDEVFTKSELYLREEQTQLNILSRKQCEKDLLNSIFQLSKSDSNISSTIIEQKLATQCPLPDPEVAIVIGRKLSSYGLLPWNIRLTEFFQFNNYYDISVSKFNNILKKFSKCEQRYGK